MADIFGNSAGNYPKVTGGIRFTGAAVMGFGPNGKDSLTGMVIQNYSINYNQNITKLRGLNTANITVVVAPPSGTMSINTAITEKDGYLKFLKDYGNPCNVNDNQLQVHSFGAEGCGDQTNPKSKTFTSTGKQLPAVTLTGCIISSLTLSQQIESLVLMSTVNVDFVAMKDNHNQLDADGAGGKGAAPDVGGGTGDYPGYAPGIS